MTFLQRSNLCKFWLVIAIKRFLNIYKRGIFMGGPTNDTCKLKRNVYLEISIFVFPNLFVVVETKVRIYKRLYTPWINELFPYLKLRCFYYNRYIHNLKSNNMSLFLRIIIHLANQIKFVHKMSSLHTSYFRRHFCFFFISLWLQNHTKLVPRALTHIEELFVGFINGLFNS